MRTHPAGTGHAYPNAGGGPGVQRSAEQSPCVIYHANHSPSSVINHVVIMSVTSLSIIYQVYIIISIYIHLSFDLSSYAFIYLFMYS